MTYVSDVMYAERGAAETEVPAGTRRTVIVCFLLRPGKAAAPHDHGRPLTLPAIDASEAREHSKATRIFIGAFLSCSTAGTAPGPVRRAIIQHPIRA